jgi:hypothetical protein
MFEIYRVQLILFFILPSLSSSFFFKDFILLKQKISILEKLMLILLYHL